MVLHTPVVFIIFNRPDLTAIVFEAIRKVAPKTLYVVADGPRTPDEKSKTDASRAVIETIDWPCQVHKNYSDINVGCKMRVSSGITWVFEQVEEAIILEDDCLPDPSFFSFCEEMLDRYRNDARVMHIGGTNFQLGNTIGNGDYYYSNYIHIWGWATWRRAWNNYDITLHELDNFIAGKLPVICNYDQRQIDFWSRSFKKVRSGNFDTWDFQWHYSIWNAGGIGIIPNKNLVKNIGFRSDGTHTKGENELINKIPLQHLLSFGAPGNLHNVEIYADNFTFYSFYYSENKKNGIARRLKEKLKFFLSGSRFWEDLKQIGMVQKFLRHL